MTPFPAASISLQSVSAADFEHPKEPGSHPTVPARCSPTFDTSSFQEVHAPHPELRNHTDRDAGTSEMLLSLSFSHGCPSRVAFTATRSGQLPICLRAGRQAFTRTPLLQNLRFDLIQVSVHDYNPFYTSPTGHSPIIAIADMYAGRTHQHMGLALALVAYVGLGVNLAAAKIERFERVPTLEDLGAHLASGLDPKWLVPAYDSGAWKLDGEVLGWETSLELMQQQETSWVKRERFTVDNPQSSANVLTAFV